MKKFILGFILGMLVSSTLVIAASNFYDSEQRATDPYLAVCRQSDGTYTPVTVDSNGNPTIATQ